MNETPSLAYFVGLIENPSHPFNTFLVGYFVEEKENCVVLFCPAKILEVPDRNGVVSLSFVPDAFFSVSQNIEIPKSRFIMSRLLDHEKDVGLINNINESYLNYRAQKSGLITSSLPLNKRMLNENK